MKIFRIFKGFFKGLLELTCARKLPILTRIVKKTTHIFYQFSCAKILQKYHKITKKHV
jgi:hypothetical protein